MPTEMDPIDKDAAIKRYEERIKRLGPTVQALGWKDIDQQRLRFSILAGIADLDGKSILDVGCGFGDFYGFLISHGKEVDYTGIDISLEALSIAKDRYPDARFEERDILSGDSEKRFDYVVESGVFNHVLLDNETFARAMLRTMFNVSNHGVAVNMLTDYVDYKEDHLYYYNPEAYFRYCKTLSKLVTLRHDYPLYEFTLYVYR